MSSEQLWNIPGAYYYPSSGSGFSSNNGRLYTDERMKQLADLKARNLEAQERERESDPNRVLSLYDLTAFPSDAKFPTAAIPTSIRDAVLAFSLKTSTPASMTYFTMVAALASVYAPQIDVLGIHDEPIPLTHFVVIEAPSGARKSTLVRRIFREIIQFDIDVLNRYRAKGKNHVRSLRLVISDTTLPALLKHAESAYPAGVILNSDASQQIKRLFFSQSRLLCEMWSGETTRVMRVNYESLMLEPRYSICLMTQVGAISDKLVMDNELRDSGLAARCFIVNPNIFMQDEQAGLSDPSRSIDELINDWDRTIKNQLVATFGLGTQYPKHRRTLSLHEGAAIFLRDLSWKIESALSRYGQITEHREEALRVVEKVTRLAALHALWENPQAQEITFEQAYSAYRVVWAYEGYFTRKIAGQIIDRNIEEDAKLLLDFVKRDEFLAAAGQFWYDKYNGMRHAGIAKSFLLQRGPNRLRKKAALEAALAYLMTLGKVYEYPIQATYPNGTPTTVQVVQFNF